MTGIVPRFSLHCCAPATALTHNRYAYTAGSAFGKRWRIEGMNSPHFSSNLGNQVLAKIRLPLGQCDLLRKRWLTSVGNGRALSRSPRQMATHWTSAIFTAQSGSMISEIACVCRSGSVQRQDRATCKASVKASTAMHLLQLCLVGGWVHRKMAS